MSSLSGNSEKMIYFITKKNVSDTNKEDKNSMQILEEALVLCEFGRFHIRLLLAGLAAVYASTMVISTSSYILPNAECDLNMTIMQKGLLNAVPFLGILFFIFIEKRLCLMHTLWLVNTCK